MGGNGAMEKVCLINFPPSSLIHANNKADLFFIAIFGRPKYP